MPDWRNRIVGYAERDPRDLTANPLNWRLHPESQRQALDETLAQVGWVQCVVVNRTTGRIVDGHLRVEEALAAKAPTVPVLEVELTEAEERLVLATLDPLAAMADTDQDLLDQLLAELGPVGAALDELLLELQPDEVERDWPEPSGASPEPAGPSESDEEDAAGPEARHALSIVLTNVQKRQWEAYKERLGVAGDTTAFLRVLEGLEV